MTRMHSIGWASLVSVFAADAAAQSSSPPPAETSVAHSASEAPESSSSPPPASVSAPARPRLTHTPVLAAASEVPIALSLDVTHADRVASVDVFARALPDEPWAHFVAARSPAGGYLVTLPPQPPRVRALGYYIVVRTSDGAVLPAFATPEAPHVIVVRPSADWEQERRELTAHAGQRLLFTAGGEYTNFGNRSADHCNGTSACQDYWYSLYGSVEYRFFRVVRSVSVRVERILGVTTRVPNGVATQQDIGLVAATSSLEFRLSPGISFFVSGILGANQTAVTGGGGALLAFGVDTPTRLEIGWSGIVDYGMTASAWMRFYTIPELPFGGGVEVTNQPAGSGPFGVRLLVEAAHPFGRYVSVVVRGGYGARALDAGGFTGGGAVQLHF